MEKNVGGTDRVVRFVVASALLIAAFGRKKGWTRQAAIGLAASLLRSAVSQECPINHALGIDTYHGSRAFAKA